MAESLLIGKGTTAVYLRPEMTNRHGLIAGATGTGKTVSLRVVAEQLSRIGVPSFMADVKSDLSGVARPGTENPKVSERVQKLGLKDFAFAGSPTVFWDVFGEQGHPVRATVSEMGPLLLSRLLDLNETQSGVLSLVFRIADDNGLLLLDLKDLRSLLQFTGDNADQFRTSYGNVSAASIGTIQRALLALQEQGGDRLFGEPAFDLEDLIQTRDGRGVINILAADKLMGSPKVYSTLLLWMLAELFERLPEVGDVEKPKLVFFFDEAHLLFDEAPKALREKIEQVVRLIRSKGIGVFFITQNPLDVPEDVLGQLGNRVQHAIRAYTPKEQKAIKAAAETFRSNPKLDVAKTILELGVGEALVSTLDEKGTPTMVERALIRPPQSRFAPLSPDERQQVVQQSVLFGHYEKAVDRESAFEVLKARAAAAAQAAPAAPLAAPTAAPGAPPPGPRGRGGVPRDQMAVLFGAAATSAVRAASSQLGRSLIRGVLGSLLGGGGRRR